jgi:hypothetical protein
MHRESKNIRRRVEHGVSACGEMRRRRLGRGTTRPTQDRLELPDVRVVPTPMLCGSGRSSSRNPKATSCPWLCGLSGAPALAKLRWQTARHIFGLGRGVS